LQALWRSNYNWFWVFLFYSKTYSWPFFL